MPTPEEPTSASPSPAEPTPEERLERLGVSLPTPAAPVAAYVPCVRTGNLVYVSGQVPMVDGTPSHLGHLGDDVDPHQEVVPPRTTPPTECDDDTREGLAGIPRQPDQSSTR